MIGGLHAVAEATAVVFVGGRRVGAAVLVDRQHLLTAAHVLARVGAGGETVLPDEVELVFPLAATTVGEPKVKARPVSLGISAGAVDASVLDLGDTRPPWLPRPVPLWAGEGLPAHVSVFGFPLSERQLGGVWREFEISGPAGGGRVQLEWAGPAGTLPGHSGGPVVDTATAALVGVLVEGSTRGLFDRFVPLTCVRRAWPALPNPWLMAGIDARDHFIRRAHGQRSKARGGDLFRGRTAALAAVRDWLTRQDSPGRPLVVTGQPGAGKSAVVARAALGLERDGLGPGLAFHANAATHKQFLAAVADLIGVNGADSRDTLIDAVRDMTGEAQWTIVVDALDEAISADQRQLIAETLNDLGAMPRFRVAVATRPLAIGNRYSTGGLLRTLGVSSASTPNLVDLDTDRYFDRSGLEAFAAALLSQDGADYPGPPGAAWSTYRLDSRLSSRLAAVVARRAQRNYLVAAMAAVPLSTAEDALDPDVPDFDAASIPSGIGEALSKYLGALPNGERVPTRGLLTALAYARGEGVDDRMWLRFAGALGYPAIIADLDRLRDSAAADYLLQSVRAECGPVTRLFHQALTDELLASRHQPTDERAVLQTLIPEPNADGWINTTAYARAHAADHAAISGDLPHLLDDAHYLAVADLSRLLPLLTPPQRFGAIAGVLHRAGDRAGMLPPTRRVRLLAVTAAHLGLPQLQRQLEVACTDGVAPRWAHTLGDVHKELSCHSPVDAVALGRIDGRDVIVSGGGASMLQLWDPTSGQAIGASMTGHTHWVTAVVMGRIGERDVIVSGSQDETVRIWDARQMEPIGAGLVGHTGWVTSVALGCVAAQQVIVSGSSDGTVRIWDARSGEPLGALTTGYGGWVLAVALGRIGDRDVIVSGSTDHTVQIWDAGTRQPLGAPLTGHTLAVSAVALGRIGERDLIVSGSGDATVRIWDAGTCKQVGAPLSGHTNSVNAVALGRIGERQVIVSCSGDRTVRIWDPTTNQAIGAPLTGHGGWVAALALGRIGEREVIVSGSHDETLRIWEASNGEPLGAPLIGHTDSVNAVALGRIGGQEMIASGSHDNTVRIWNALNGHQVGVPLTGHIGSVTAVALGSIGERGVLVSGGHDRTVRLWDPDSSRQLGDPLTGHSDSVNALALGRIKDREVIVSGSLDGTVRIWDAHSGKPLGTPLAGYDGWVTAMALGRIGKREVIVFGDHNGRVQIWDARREELAGMPLIGHAGFVSAVALGRIGEREVIVSGGIDTTVRLWDARRGEPLGNALTGHQSTVEAVVVGSIGAREVIVSGSWDGTVRVWDARERTQIVLDLLKPVSALAASTEERSIFVATGISICAFAVDARAPAANATAEAGLMGR